MNSRNLLVLSLVFLICFQPFVVVFNQDIMMNNRNLANDSNPITHSKNQKRSLNESDTSHGIKNFHDSADLSNSSKSSNFDNKKCNRSIESRLSQTKRTSRNFSKFQAKSIEKASKESESLTSSSFEHESSKVRAIERRLIGTSSSSSSQGDDIDLLSGEDPNVTRIYYIGAGGNVTTYGHANETITIHFVVKGSVPSGDTLTITVHRDIVTWSNNDLAAGTYTFSEDLSANETLHFAWNVTLDQNQDNFGRSSGDIRSYYLEIELDSYGRIFWGGDGNPKHRLHMVGSLTLYGVQYYNYTESGEMIPISHAIPGWNITVKYYMAVVEAPVWDFDIQGTVKASVNWWIDETLYSDDKKYVSSRIDPGIYYYYLSDSNWDPYYMTIPTERSYGNSPGDTKNLYGTVYMDSEEISATDPDNPRNRLYILSNTVEQSPSVQVELPQDGYVTYNSSLSLSVDVNDPNSNYEIATIEVFVEDSWIDVTKYYDTTQGRIEIVITNVFTNSGVKNVTIRAVDKVGRTGTDSVLMQYFTYGHFFPSNYEVFNKKKTGEIFSKDFNYSALFHWEGGDLFANVTPYFSLSIETEIRYELLMARPKNVTPGADFNTYLKVINPQLTFSANLDLGVEYAFGAEGRFYQGSTSLYDKRLRKGLPLNFGIHRLDLREISDLIESITHWQVETADFLPTIISWLANFKFEIDFKPILKVKNLLSFDISGTNCESKTDSLTLTTDSMYTIPCTASSTATGNDNAEINLDNFRIDAGAGFEAYCQMTFSGKILGHTIGPIDVNEWLYKHLGIEIPHIDKWVWDATLHFTSSAVITIPFNPLPLSIQLAEMEYQDNITYRFAVEDANEKRVSGANVSITYHSNEYSAEEQKSGVYEVHLPYHFQNEAIIVTADKSGYLSTTTSFELKVWDSDQDSLSDIWEKAHSTDPNNPDTDNDGLSDGKEVNEYNTDPTNPDTDGDGASDGKEVDVGTDPTDPKSKPVGGMNPLWFYSLIGGVIAIIGAIAVIIYIKKKT